MTTLDKSIPNYPILMTLPKQHSCENIKLAKGYRFISYQKQYKEDWVNLHVQLGQIQSYEEGIQYFNQIFEPYPKALDKQMILVIDEHGELAGTSSIWNGNHFGNKRLRVHWVGVDPKHQRKGLAKALMIKTIAMFDALQLEDELYLTSQTNSYIAIKMYEDIGFIPYMGRKPVHFHAEEETFKKDNMEAWELIHRMIKERM